MNEKKEAYVQPALVTHELLRDITAGGSGYSYSGYQWWLRLFH